MEQEEWREPSNVAPPTAVTENNNKNANTGKFKPPMIELTISLLPTTKEGNFIHATLLHNTRPTNIGTPAIHNHIGKYDTQTERTVLASVVEPL